MNLVFCLMNTTKNWSTKYWTAAKRRVIFLLLLPLCCVISSTNTLLASDYYWVNGTGRWSEYPLHWATSSGGSVFHSQKPTVNDNVFFDSNSFSSVSDTLDIDLDSILCNTMDWSTVTNNPVISYSNTYFASSPNIVINGSLIMSPNIQWNLFAVFSFNSNQNGNSISLNGLDLLNGNTSAGFQFNGTGSWQLLDDLEVNAINFNRGTFISNGKSINSSIYSPYTQFGDTTYLYLGNSRIYGDIRSQNSNLFFDADSALFNVRSFIVNSPSFFDTVICQQGFNCKGTTINTLICHQVAGDSNLIRNVEFLNDTFCTSYPSYCNYIYGNGNLFNKVIVHAKDFDISGNNSFDTLTFTSLGQELILHGDTIIIFDELILNNSCGYITSIISKEDTSMISFPNSFSAWNNYYFQNVKNGAGTTITLNNSIDGGGNYGWNFNPPTAKTLFWVGGSGNWSNPNHWATTSGGVGGNCVPTKFDSLFFDGNSFLAQGDTVVFDLSNAYCRYFNAMTTINSPTFFEKTNIAKLNVDGSFLLSSNVNWDEGPNLKLFSQNSENDIQTAGVFLNSDINIHGSSTWNLQSDFTGKSLIMFGGKLNTNDFDLTCDISSYSSTDSISFNFGTSQVKGYNYILNFGNVVNVDADSASFDFIGTFYSANGIAYLQVKADGVYGDSCTYKRVTARRFTGVNSNVDFLDSVEYLYSNHSIFDKVEVSSPNFYLSGDTILIDSLLFSQTGVDLILYAGTVLKVPTFTNWTGACSNFASMICNTGSATFSYSGGPFVVDFVKLQNIRAYGLNSFTANNCIDLGSNVNWMINTISPRSLYWVGGSGSWMDLNHWSFTSGGPGGACVPNYMDDLFFDANSFSSIGDTVFSGIEEVQFHTLDARGVLNLPSLFIESNYVRVFGSFFLGSNMNFNLGGSLVFVSDSIGNIIQTNGTPLTGVFPTARVYFSGQGSWELESDLVTDYIHHQKGIFKTNNFAVTALEYKPSWNVTQNDSLLLGTSILRIDLIDFFNQDMYVDVDSCTFISKFFRNTGGLLYFNEVFSDYLYSSNGNYKFVECESLGGGLNYIDNVNFINNASVWGDFHFDKVILSTDLVISGNFNADTLILNNPGQTIHFYFKPQFIVNEYLQIQSNPNTPTTLRGVNGEIGKITLLSDTFCTDHIVLQNIEAIGPGVFYAGSNSLDLGNNIGWNFSSCAIDSSTVWPGDANADLIADNLDYLAIGVAYGFNGNTRQNSSLNWIPQPCLDWNYQFVNGKNYNNSDCDGNGIVNYTDTLAIIANYGLTHPLRMPSFDQASTIGVPLTFDMPTTNLVPGTVVSIPIVLGTPIFPLNNIYGIAFTINYDPSFVQAGSMQLDISNSWLGDGSNSIHIGKDLFSSGQFDVGFVRIDHQNVSGNGMIATLSFTVANGISGLFNLSFTKVVAIDKYEYSIPIQPIPSSIYTSLFEDLTLEKLVSVFPNPASDYVTVVSSNTIIRQITCLDRIGKSLFVVSGNSNRLELSTQYLLGGIYLLKIETTNGIINKKLIIRR